MLILERNHLKSMFLPVLLNRSRHHVMLLIWSAWIPKRVHTWVIILKALLTWSHHLGMMRCHNLWFAVIVILRNKLSLVFLAIYWIYYRNKNLRSPWYKLALLLYLFLHIYIRLSALFRDTIIMLFRLLILSEIAVVIIVRRVVCSCI